ncbi:MAG: heme o synthase [Chitinophagaceae bacterium]
MLHKKLKYYGLLIKFNLSFMVSFSCVLSFLMAPHQGFDWWSIVVLFIAGVLLAGGANAINQIIEVDTDKLMMRTKNRPLVLKQISKKEAYLVAWITSIVGIGLLSYFNFLAAFLGLFGLLLYAFVYTPIKKINSIAVFIGAFPGALPCLIGWCAATDDIFLLGGWLLFVIQFIWQFPHFWSIAWVVNEDYQKAGYKLLPSSTGPTQQTAIYTFIFSLLLFPCCVLCFWIGMVYGWTLIPIFFVSILLIIRCFLLLISPNVKNARKVMFACYIFLPVTQLILLLGKVHSF